MREELICIFGVYLSEREEGELKDKFNRQTGGKKKKETVLQKEMVACLRGGGRFVRLTHVLISRSGADDYLILITVLQ